MHTFNRLVDGTAGTLGFAILILVNVQIVCRFILSISVPWTEEVSRLLFVWLAMIGAAIGYREGSMIVIDTLPELGGETVRGWLRPVVGTISFLIIAFLFLASLPLIEAVWPTTLATIDWISNGWTYLAFTVSFGLMLIYAIAQLASLLGARRAQAERAS